MPVLGVGGENSAVGGPNIATSSVVYGMKRFTVSECLCSVLVRNSRVQSCKRAYWPVPVAVIAPSVLGIPMTVDTPGLIILFPPAILPTNVILLVSAVA
jgi:hypothetical protein